MMEELPVLGSCVKVGECRELKESDIREDGVKVEMEG
jgi:hypothetical protein